MGRTWVTRGWSVLALTAAMAVAGCASHVPPAIRDAPVPSPELTAVLQDPAAWEGQRVRWGGTVAAVENAAHGSVLELVARPLDRDGRPLEVDRSEGRFLARAPGFLDPAIYGVGREVTVAGTLAGVREGAIGAYPYRYPVVSVETLYLWPLEPPLPAYYPGWDPFWYPYRDPFWPHPCWRWPGRCW